MVNKGERTTISQETIVQLEAPFPLSLPSVLSNNLGLIPMENEHRPPHPEALLSCICFLHEMLKGSLLCLGTPALLSPGVQ